MFHFVPLFDDAETVTGKNALTSINSAKRCTVTYCYAFFRKTFSRDAFWSQMSLHLDRRRRTQRYGAEQSSTAYCYGASQDRQLRNRNENRNMTLTSVFHFVPLLDNNKTVTAEMTLTSKNSTFCCTVTCCYVFFRETFSTDAF